MMNRQELTQRNKDREIGQICYVTNDLKETLKYMTEKLEIGPWKLLAISNTSAENVRLDGKLVPERSARIVAIAKGGKQIKLSTCSARTQFEIPGGRGPG